MFLFHYDLLLPCVLSDSLLHFPICFVDLVLHFTWKFKSLIAISCLGNFWPLIALCIFVVANLYLMPKSIHEINFNMDSVTNWNAISFKTRSHNTFLLFKCVKRVWSTKMDFSFTICIPHHQFLSKLTAYIIRQFCNMTMALVISRSYVILFCKLKLHNLRIIQKIFVTAVAINVVVHKRTCLI